jgi:hypothetical protein
LAAQLGLACEPVPPALDKFAIGLAKPGRRTHNAVFEHAADTVARLVERRYLVLGEFRRLAEHRVGDLGDVARQIAECVEHQAHVGERGGVGHRHSPKGPSSIADRWRCFMAL